MSAVLRTVREAPLITAAFVALALAPLVLQVARMRAPLLVSHAGAEWVHPKRPFILWGFTGGEKAIFRASFALDRPAAASSLEVRSVGAASVAIDGAEVLERGPRTDAWREPRAGAVPPLAAGQHEIVAHVANDFGPALLLLSAPALGVATGRTWEASYEGTPRHPAAFQPALLASETNELDLPRRFPEAPSALASLWLVYLALFAAAFAGTLRTPAWFGAAAVRWTLLGLWAALALNNLFKLPLKMGAALLGYDAADHYQYIDFIARNWRLPTAADGRQMFQAPLYYLLSAPLDAALSHFAARDTVERLLRAVPLLCGALQVEVAWRVARRVFPDRSGPQIVAMLVAGLMPMGFYISQYAGNEPLAGLLSAVALGLLVTMPDDAGPRPWAVAGAVIGLALLAKVTAALLFLPLLWAAVRMRPVPWRNLAVAAGCAAAICGWFYLRSFIQTGTPLVLSTPFAGGHESSATRWWQDPGYRTPRDLLTFGAALVRPIYAGIHGFWDSIWSTMWLDGALSGVVWPPPPWNYRPMSALALWSLLPAAAIAAGFVRAFSKSPPAGSRLCALAVVAYFAAVAGLYAGLPIYSAGKATYALGLLPAYGLLGAAGFELLPRNGYARAAANGALLCWAASAFAAFFVL